MTLIDDALTQTAAYWHNYYTRHNQIHEPSPFARWCLEHPLPSGSHILDLGCGNGRDSFAFLHHGLPVLAVDGCKVVISDNAARYSARKFEAHGHFLALDFSELDRLGPDDLAGVNLVYSRFVLHDIPEALEDELLDFCQRILPPGGRMLHEFRTLRDPMMQRGKILSAKERFTDHYRRFLDPDIFRSKLAARGWQELFFVESNGLAPLGNDDPFVARVVAEKLPEH